MKAKHLQAEKRCFWLIVLAVFTLAAIIQWHIFMSRDVGWHLLAAERLLKGGTYSQDFLDVSPPMIFYLLLPPLLIQHLFQGNLILSFRVYLFLISFLSLLTCFAFTHRLFGTKDRLMHGMLLLTLAVVYLLLPVSELGQRDPFVMVLIMPYLLAIGTQAQHKDLTLSPFLMAWVGLLARLGFSLNLQFFILFIMLEFYLIQRRALVFRVESLMIIAVFIFYLLSIFLFFPDYITQVLPLVISLYTSTFNDSLPTLADSAALFSWLAAFLFFIIDWKKSRYQPLFLVFFLAATVSVILFLFTRKIWYYHQVPTIGFSTLLLALFLAQNQQPRLRHSGKTIILCILLMGLPIFTIAQLSFSNWKKKSNPHNGINQILTYVQERAEGKSVMVFSTTVTPAGLLIPYAKVNLGSRFAGFWMLPGILKRENESLNPMQKQKLNEEKQRLNNMVVEDFSRYKPKLVLVDIASSKEYLSGISFDYIRYFSHDPRFVHLWRAYRYQTTIANFAIYGRG